MKQKLIVIIIALFFAVSGFAQQLPWGTCGIVNVYDAAGNRTKRVYFCNNGDPYPKRNPKETMEFQAVDALYPNPTTGAVSVTFSKSLQNAVISITDNYGKVVTQFKGSGYKVDFDLSSFAAGIYFVRIEENGKTISKKVIKQ